MTPEDLKESLLLAVGLRGEFLLGEILRPISITLKAAQVRILTPDEYIIVLPHYWAVFLHDGRGEIVAAPGRFLAWFKDPADDPRLQGDPQRLSDVKYLRQVWSAALFKAALRDGRLVLAKRSGATIGKQWNPILAEQLKNDTFLQTRAAALMKQFVVSQLPPLRTVTIALPFAP